MSSPLASTLHRPIVVVGAPRSGTTFLGDILGRHPDLAHVAEPRLTWRYGNDDKCDMFRPDDARPEVCRYIRDVFASAVLAAGKQRLVEKTPSNSLRMGFVERVLPGCIFVHILRDGVESTLAIRRFWQQHARGFPQGKFWTRLREIRIRQIPYYAREFTRRAAPRPFRRFTGRPAWGPRIPGIDGLLRDLSLLEVCALQWRVCVEAACHYGRSLPAGRYMECRLEQMSPELLRRIFEFCQLRDSPEVWQAFEEEFRPQQTRHRRAEAEPEEIELLQRWLAPTMHWLGYKDLHAFDGST